MKIYVIQKRVHVGDRFAVSFRRTLRVPEDGGDYPLPPGLGTLPVQSVGDFKGRVPREWEEEGGVFIPLYQREAMWLAFTAAAWKPNAVKVGVGGVNALTGATFDARLRAEPQDYLVCPPQPWLDGINVGGGRVRQFVAMPLGAGYSVESQLGDAPEFGGLRIHVYDPTPGRFPDEPPENLGLDFEMSASQESAAEGLGVAAGGLIRQKIYPDPHGVEIWDQAAPGSLAVRIVNSMQYEEITGHAPPPTPVTQSAYAEHGLAWLSLYDEGRATIPAPDRMRGVKSVREVDAQRGEDAGDESGDTPNVNVRKSEPV